MFFNFFKTPEVRQFEHIPIYWDPRKEAMEERRQRMRQEGENETGNHNLRPQSTLQRGFLTRQRSTQKSSRQGGTIRLALIIALLFGCVVWMMS